MVDRTNLALGVFRHGRTGDITAVRCPGPWCARVIAIQNGRFVEHESGTFTMVAKPCRMSGVEVRDEAHPDGISARRRAQSKRRSKAAEAQWFMERLS